MTIRLDTHKFKISKSQKRVKRRWKSFLEGKIDVFTNSKPTQGPEENHIGGSSPKRPRENDLEMVANISREEEFDIRGLGQSKRQRSNLNLKSLDVFSDECLGSPSAPFSEKLRVGSCEALDTKQKGASGDFIGMITRALEVAIRKAVDTGEIPPGIHLPPVIVKEASDKVRRLHGRDILYTSGISFSLAAKAKSVPETTGLTAEDISKILAKHVQLDFGELSVHCAGGHLNILGKGDCDEQKVESHPRISKQKAKRSCGHSFRIVTLASSDPSIPEIEFDLFKKYQTKHHDDDPMSVTVESFRRFLCDSPLIHVPPSECPQGPSCGYGSFHQQYWVDNELIAVGVVDILPKCLSSKYFFWDPSMAKLSLGTLASLLEIDWISEQSKHAKDFHYYYLGYYLHDCHRMNYKASFAPSELLCPTTYKWVPITKVVHLLDANQPPWDFSEFESEGNNLPDEEGTGEKCLEVANNYKGSDDLVDHVKLMIPYPGTIDRLYIKGGRVLDFGRLRTLGLIRSPEAEENLRSRISEWIYFVGPAWNMMLFGV